MPQETTSLPQWQTDYIKKLQERAATLGGEKYKGFNYLSAPEKEDLKRKIKSFENLQTGKEFSFIPFSITGKSKPINLTPQELKKISDNEGFAADLYRKATGILNISPSEIQDIQERAKELFRNKDILGDLEKRKEAEYIKNYEQNRKHLEKFLPYIRSEYPQLKAIRYDPNRTEVEYGNNYQVRPESYKEKDLEAAEAFLKEKRKKRLENNTEKEVMPYFLSHYPQLKAIRYDPNRTEVEYGNNYQVRPESYKEKDLEAAEAYEMQQRKKEYPAGLKGLGKKLIHSGDIEDIFSRAGAEREINNLMKEKGHIAPMNEIHEQAHRMLEQGFDEDSLDLARDEINASRKSSRKEIDPYLQKAMENPFEENTYTQKYMNEYQKSVIKALKDETQESLLKDIIPKINTSFAQHGAYHSGARMEAIRKATEAKEKNLHREIAHLLHGAHEKGMEHYQADKNRALQAADVVKNSSKIDQDAAQQRASHFYNQGIAKHEMTHKNTSALTQLARAKQEQEQNEINVRKAEFEKEKNHEWEQLGKENALLRGMPMTSQTTVSSGQPSTIYAPSPPNPYNLVGGGMSMLYNMLPQNKAKGGSVKRYAAGGNVRHDAMSHLKTLIQEQQAADTQRLERSQIDPLRNWIGHVGQSMLDNVTEDPLVNVAKGTSNALRGMEASKEKAANLYDKIQESRMNQYKVLADFETKEASRSQEEKKLEHQKNALDAMNERHKATLSQKERLANKLLGAKYSASGSKKETVADRKMVEEAKKDLRRAARLKKEVGHLGSLLKDTTTGPVVGNLKKILPSTKTDNQIRVGTNKLILDLHQGMKNIPRSEEFLKRIDSTKFDLANHPEANQEAVNLMMSGADDIEQNSISTLLAAGWTPQKIERVFKVKVPENLLEEGGSQEESEPEDDAHKKFLTQHILEDEAPEGNEENSDDMVEMIGPDGSHAYVPRMNVQNALNMGALYAQ